MADDIIEADEAAAKRAARQAYMRRYYLDRREAFIARAKAWKVTNSERAKALDKEADKRWKAANPDRVKAKMDKWREANREVAREATRKWRAEHPERARAAVHRWIDNNPDQVKALKARRRARELGAEGSFTASDIEALLRTQRGRCAYCAASIRNGYHIDHIIPLARGGTNWPKNLQLTCERCNHRKHAKDPIAFAQENGKLL